MAIQSLLLDLTRQFVESLPAGAKITIDGEVKDFPISYTRYDGSAVKKFVYIDHEVGHITRAALVDAMGRELDVKELDVIKGDDGFTQVFVIDVSLKEAQ